MNDVHLDKDDSIYKEYLLEYYKNPRNYGAIENCDIQKHDHNPLCGDEIDIYIQLDKNHNKKTIEKIQFTGKGCVVCIASASILTEHLEGMDIEGVKDFSREDFLKLLGLNLTPTRVKCAMLPLAAIKKGIMDFEAKS